MRFRPSGGLGHGSAKARPRSHPGARRSGRRNRARRRRFMNTATRTKSNAPKISPPACRPKACRRNRQTPRTSTKADFREPHLRHARAGAGGKAFEPVPVKEQPEGHRGNHPRRRDQPGQESPAADQAGKESPQGSHHQRRDARNARRRVWKTASWRNSTSSAPPRSASSAASSKARCATSKTA